MRKHVFVGRHLGPRGDLWFRHLSRPHRDPKTWSVWTGVAVTAGPFRFSLIWITPKEKKK